VREVKHTQDFHPGGRCSCPALNQIKVVVTLDWRPMWNIFMKHIVVEFHVWRHCLLVFLLLWNTFDFYEICFFRSDLKFDWHVRRRCCWSSLGMLTGRSCFCPRVTEFSPIVLFFLIFLRKSTLNLTCFLCLPTQKNEGAIWNRKWFFRVTP